MKRFFSVLFLPLLLFFASPAAAQSAGSKEECEKKYPNPMEFNLCLASLSPVRGRVTADRPPSGEGRSYRGRGGRIQSVRRGGRVSSTVYLGGAPVQRGSGGRKRITFDVRR